MWSYFRFFRGVQRNIRYIIEDNLDPLHILIKIILGISLYTVLVQVQQKIVGVLKEKIKIAKELRPPAHHHTFEHCT